MILLDTIVLSELRKSRPCPKVIAWLQGREERELFISVVSIGEIERGIEKQRKMDADVAGVLTSWLNTLMTLYADRLLPVTPEIARRWGVLSVRVGYDSADLLIAASALCHGLQVATRNVRHFESTGVVVVDPFDAA